MKKRLTVAAMLLTCTTMLFAGGLLTNTNQHISFLRMIARGATIDIDGVYSNPAGLGFMADGIYLSANIQSAYQTRVIDADFLRPDGERHIARYKGTASAPVIPSFQAVYKKGDWAISGSFAITGGGGKASFDTGLPLFDAKVMSLMNAGGVPPTYYTINSAMDGKQYIYGLQLGLSYKINKYFSVFGGGRMNFVSSGYEGFVDVISVAGDNLQNLSLDCSQSGWGLTPIIGVDFKYKDWNFAAKYEFKSNLNIENKTKTFNIPDGIVDEYKDGRSTPHDIPALLMLAAGYNFTPKLRASVEYHQFFDKDAKMAYVTNVNGESVQKQKTLKGNTHEVLAGIEWDINEFITVSGGYQKTNYGLSKEFQSDLSFSCNSYSIGLGGALHFSPKVTMNIGYFWTTYSDYTVDTNNYKGTGLAGTDIYSRTNKVFGVGIDYKF